jgi:hypothetical protein
MSDDVKRTRRAVAESLPHEKIIRIAREVHRQHWRMSGDEGTGDKLAAVVTEGWQNFVLSELPGRFAKERKIADHLNERIDLVDMEAGIAYELKVSPNNDHMEFYRDIFKVLVARNHTLPDLKAFYFICPREAVSRYKRGLRKAVLEESARLGFSLSVAEL